MLVNNCTFTGEIIDIRKKANTFGLLVKNTLNGKAVTKFPVFMDESIFESLSLNIGDKVAVLNAIMFCEDNKKRFLVQNPGQVQVIMNYQNEFSYATFSGEIASLEEDDEVCILTLKQNPLEKLTEFQLVMKKELYESLYLTFGDEVLIHNAQIYQKADRFRFRIMHGSQLSIIKRNNPDAGIVNAEDKFI